VGEFGILNKRKLGKNSWIDQQRAFTSAQDHATTWRPTTTIINKG